MQEEGGGAAGDGDVHGDADVNVEAAAGCDGQGKDGSDGSGVKELGGSLAYGQQHGWEVELLNRQGPMDIHANSNYGNCGSPMYASVNVSAAIV